MARPPIAEAPAVVWPGPAVQEPPPAEAPVTAGLVATPGAGRIAGVLVTYTWDRGGQLFAVREGRNRVGSDPRCEIALNDPQLSPRHATIVCHRGHFFISDDRSRAGTDVNGERLSSHRPLPDRALIRTGGTTWLFLALEPPGGEKPALVP